MSEGRAENVDMLKGGLMRVQRLTGADCNPGLGRHSRRFRTVYKARRGDGESQCGQGFTHQRHEGDVHRYHVRGILGGGAHCQPGAEEEGGKERAVRSHPGHYPTDWARACISPEAIRTLNTVVPSLIGAAGGATLGDSPG